MDALKEAIKKHGRLEIFSTDQDSQFNSEEFTPGFKENGIQINTDGNGAVATLVPAINMLQYINANICYKRVQEYF